MGKKKDPNSLYNREMRRFERELFEWTITQVGSVSKAAEVLGLDRKHLADRVKACGADVEAAKAAARKAARGEGDSSAQTGDTDG